MEKMEFNIRLASMLTGYALELNEIEGITEREKPREVEKDQEYRWHLAGTLF